MKHGRDISENRWVDKMECRDCKEDKAPSEFPYDGTSKLFGQVCKACNQKTIAELTFRIAESDYENQLPPYLDTELDTEVE